MISPHWEHSGLRGSVLGAAFHSLDEKQGPRWRLPDKYPYSVEFFTPTRMRHLGITLVRVFHHRRDTTSARIFGFPGIMADSDRGLRGQSGCGGVVLEGSGATGPGQVLGGRRRHG